MKKLLNEWKLYLEKSEDQARKSNIIMSIIEKYTTGKHPKVDFTDLSKIKDMAYDKEGVIVSPTAAFFPKKNEIILDINIWENDFSQSIKDVLHEIAHANQKDRWEHMGISGRQKYISGKKIPKSIKYRDDLKNLKWSQLSNYWNKAYDYFKAPHEIEAKAFADRKYKEIMLSLSA